MCSGHRRPSLAPTFFRSGYCTYFVKDFSRNCEQRLALSSMESSHNDEDAPTRCRLLDASTGRPIHSSGYIVTQSRRIGPIEYFIRALAENVSLSIPYEPPLVGATNSTVSRSPAPAISGRPRPKALPMRSHIPRIETRYANISWTVRSAPGRYSKRWAE
jgi:hypothetical protein